jgi:hypothetical protein
MLLERDPPINWHEVILDFVRARWTLCGVARSINVAPSTLGRWWYSGSNPRFEDGRALLKLHETLRVKNAKALTPRQKAALNPLAHARANVRTAR